MATRTANQTHQDAGHIPERTTWADYYRRPLTKYDAKKDIGVFTRVVWRVPVQLKDITGAVHEFPVELPANVIFNPLGKVRVIVTFDYGRETMCLKGAHDAAIFFSQCIALESHPHDLKLCGEYLERVRKLDSAATCQTRKRAC